MLYGNILRKYNAYYMWCISLTKVLCIMTSFDRHVGHHQVKKHDIYTRRFQYKIDFFILNYCLIPI